MTEQDSMLIEAPGRAEREAEVEALARRAADPTDPYTGTHDKESHK